MNAFVPHPPSPACDATVVVPVRNEERRLHAALTALHNQRFDRQRYEVIVLLNNCRDGSVSVAREFQRAHPTFALHLVERELPGAHANVGTARRLLMDEAARRLPRDGVILSTDGDSQVAGDWVSNNLEAIRAGADAVGGAIAFSRPEYDHLPAPARRLIGADAHYHRLATLLESQVDPVPHDPWPRHHQHFGASLACRASIYHRVGGLPHVDCLEDVAFVESLARLDARVRHSPDVRVSTAPRLHGRVRVGLSSQLREWRSGPDWQVDSAVFLRHYFAYRAQLRKLWERQHSANPRLLEQIRSARTFGALHAALDLRHRLWKSYPERLRTVPIEVAIRGLRRLTRHAVAGHPGDSVLHDRSRWCPIPGGFENSHVPDRRSSDNPLLRA